LSGFVEKNETFRLADGRRAAVKEKLRGADGLLGIDGRASAPSDDRGRGKLLKSSAERKERADMAVAVVVIGYSNEQEKRSGRGD